MASEKISDMPIASLIDNDSFIPVVVAGGNYKVYRNTYLTCGPGQTIGLHAANCSLQLSDIGAVSVTVALTQFFSVNQSGSGAILELYPSGSWILQSDVGGSVQMKCGTALIECFGGNSIQIFTPAGVNPGISYHPAHPGDWVGGVSDVINAIDRLARVVSALGTAPIP